jgi:hypothetical protein
MNSVIVRGIETVPDLSGYAAAKGIGAATDDQVREASSSWRRISKGSKRQSLI